MPLEETSTLMQNWDLSRHREEILPFGTLSSPRSIHSIKYLEPTSYEGTSSSNLTSPSKESGGTRITSSSTRNFPVNHYALTFRPHTALLMKDLAEQMRHHPNVRAYLIGPLESKGKVDSQPHYHCYLRLRIRQKPFVVHSMFPMRIPWLKPIEPNYKTTFTHTEAVTAYIKYACKGGKPMYSGGDFQTRYPKSSKCKEILAKIKEGKCRTELETEYPTMVSQIGKMMAHRSPRLHETQCLYVWSPPGTGKSTTIHKVLQTIQSMNNAAGYYAKMGALKKFWDGYDNQPSVFIDDSTAGSVMKTLQPSRMWSLLVHTSLKSKVALCSSIQD